jgi:hypothetical protein
MIYNYNFNNFIIIIFKILFLNYIIINKLFLSDKSLLLTKNGAL